MRIGLVTNMMDGQNAGIGRYTENLVKNLFLIDRKNEYYLIHSNKKKYHFKGNFQEIRLPFFDSIPKKLITGTFLFEKICRDNKLDILHDLGQISPFLFKSKTKKILTVFDLSPVIHPEYFTRLTAFYTKLFPLVFKNTNHILTISQNSKQDIQKIFTIPKEKITVTYLGIEDKFKPIKNKIHLETIRKKYNLPKRFILYVGTIEPRKNLPALLKACSKITKKIDTRLVIVGQIGWKYDEVFQAIRRYKLEKDVILTGYVNDNDLPALYNLADVFVYPSLYEGFGFPVLEAMACGCPVITSNTSSFPEIVEDAGMMINPNNLDKELLFYLERILGNSNTRKDFISKGYIRAQNFSWKESVKQTLNIYKKINENI